MNAEQVALFYQNGSSDKVYQAQLVPVTGGWTVNCQYGGRGKALTSITKTKHPIEYVKAKKAYDAVVRQKMSKGYTPDGSGEAFANTEHAGKKTPYLPQLLNETTEQEILSLFGEGNELWMQAKHDGQRRGVIITRNNVAGANRKGLEVALKGEIHKACHALSKSVQPLVLDTEDMGSHLMLFDVLRYEDDLKPMPFSQRIRPLVQVSHHIFTNQLDKFLQVDLPCKAKSERHIKDFIAKARAKNEEGVVFRMDAPYTPGRPNSGGPCLKLKFWESATCMVFSNHPTKRSIGLAVYDGDQVIHIGNCTVPIKYNIPEVESLVEIKYLYAYKGGSLFEPSYKGERDDLGDSAADISQLKYKK